MIPYAIFGAELNTVSERLDLSAAEISVEGFAFRVLRDHPEGEILRAGKLRLRFSEPGKADRWLEFHPEPGKADRWLEFHPEPGKADRWPDFPSEAGNIDPEGNRMADSIRMADCSTMPSQNPENLSEEHPDAGMFCVSVDESEENDDLAGAVRWYRVRIDHPDYRREVNRLMAAWSGYVRGKMAGDDAELAGKMTGYPAEKEQEFPKNRAEQRQRQMDEIRKKVTAGRTDEKSETDNIWRTALDRFPEIGLSLDRPELYRRYLSLSSEEFSRRYWEELGLLGHPLAGLLQETGRIHVIGIGNPGCIRLFPDHEEMMLLLERVKKDGCLPFVQLPPLREMELERGEEILRTVIRWSEEEQWPLEILVNDWGILRIAVGIKDAEGRKLSKNTEDRKLSKSSVAEKWKIVLGSALVKYRRDVRLSWMHWSAEQLAELGECPGMPEFYVRWLQEEMRVDGMLWESAGYDMQLPGNKDRDSGPGKKKLLHILQLPFYTMNLSGNCTLYAVCRNGDRGHQRPVTECPEYCREHAFLYPDFLGMTGRYNGLFGMDSRILEQPDALEHWADQGVTRLMWNIL